MHSLFPPILEYTDNSDPREEAVQNTNEMKRI